MRLVLTLTMLSIMWGGEKPPQDPKDSKPQPKAKVSDSTRAKLWRSIADSNAAQLKYNIAQAALKEAQDMINKECGGRFNLDQAGEPQCSPPEVKEETK